MTARRGLQGGVSAGGARRKRPSGAGSPAARAPAADVLLAAWATNSRVTAFLVEHLPGELWRAAIPGIPTRKVRSVAAHLHNSRCMWIKTLGLEHGVAVPRLVNHRTVTPRQLVPALGRSARGIAALLELGARHGGRVPPSRRYVWRNLPLDVGHVLTYFVAHEGHHRGQIVMAARQLGIRLPREVTEGLWQWQRRSREGPARGAGRVAG